MGMHTRLEQYSFGSFSIVEGLDFPFAKSHR